MDIKMSDSTALLDCTIILLAKCEGL